MHVPVVVVALFVGLYNFCELDLQLFFAADGKDGAHDELIKVPIQHQISCLAYDVLHNVVYGLEDMVLEL